MESEELNTSANSRRIAKNTLILYARMFLMMLVSLYTSRVILNALGVDDYGIYNVVGGVVAMFSIISGTLNVSIGRFISFAIGEGDLEKLKKIFCTSVNVQLVLIAIVTILMETIGLWFLNYKMVIPADRLYAANWVFQFSILTFALNLWSVPYNAAIVSHERMSAFAYITIFEGLAKLLIAFVILKNPFDRLIYYGLLLLLVAIVERSLYTTYCVRNFEECKYHFIFDKKVSQKIFSFAGWNFMGASAAILRDQGGNMLLNLFFGPAVNAARGVAMSVNSIVSSFVSNFQMAFSPQITKNYAAGNFEYMFKVIFQGARLSYYILLIIALPIIFTAPYLLHLWLGTVPEHSDAFVCLVLAFSMSESLAFPLVSVMLATGNIRNYQIVVGSLLLFNFPIDYLLLRLGFPPEVIYVVAIIISIGCEMLRLVMLRKMIQFPVRSFLQSVYFNVFFVTAIACILPSLARCFCELDSFISFFAIATIAFVSSVVVIYTIGCTKHDRELIHAGVNKVIQRFK